MSARYENMGGVWTKTNKRYANIGGVQTLVNKRYDNVNGVWTPSYSSAFCSVAMTQTWLTATLTVGNDGSLIIQITNNTASSVTGNLASKVYLDFTLDNAITLTNYEELFRLINVVCSLSSGYSGASLRVEWDIKTSSGWSGTTHSYEGVAGLTVNSTTNLLTRDYGSSSPNPTITALRLAIIFYNNRINAGGTLSITIPAGGLYITGQQVNGFN